MALALLDHDGQREGGAIDPSAAGGEPK